jgi:hypothetical protein
MQSRAAAGLTTDRALARAAGAASLLVLGALFWPAAFRRMFVYGDLGGFFLPFRIFLSEHLARGITPLWMPNLFCGFYVHGEGQIGIVHPLRWLLYRLLPVPEAFNLECILPYPLALFGIALFVRRLALPTSAAIFGGASFAFSAYLTARLTHVNAITVIAHLGWLLFAIDVLLRETGARWRAWLGVALVTGSQLLVGYPVAVAYCWLIALPYALFVAARERRPGPLLAVASALAVGGLLGGIQLLPTWEHLAASQRAHSDYVFLTEQSLHPLNLLTIVAPWLFGHRLYMDGAFNQVEQVCYLGAIAPIAALWVGLRWRKLGTLRPLVAGLVALSAVALLLSLGGHTGLYRYVLAIPIVGSLRVPARYDIALYFAGAVFAAIAFADLLRGDAELGRRVKWIWVVPAASACVAGVAFALIHTGRGAEWQLNTPGPVAVGPLVFALAAALFTAAAHGRRLALYGLIALTLADHAVYAATLWWIEPPHTLAGIEAGIVSPPAAPPLRVYTPKSFGTYLGSDGRGHWWTATTLIVHDARLVSGYAGLMPAKQLDYSKLASLRVASAAVQLVGLRFVRLPGPLPRARLVAHAVRSAQPASDIELINVANAALVEEPVDLEAGPAGAAAILEDLPGAIRIAVDAPTRQLLVLAESFHPGWRARIDGADVRVLRVNGDFIGVVVEPGVHELGLSFAPRSFALGCWTSLAGIAIVLAVALVGLTNGFTRPASSP